MIFDEIDDLNLKKTKIKVIGVGGGGKNALNHMIENDVRGVEFIAVNTDAQDLKASKAPNRLLIGKTKTHGQGAGANPEIGRAAALEAEDDIHEMIGDAQMVFITCGMGGGTGTGASPVIARIAREHGCLTIGVCTKPFQFEGPKKMDNAVKGLEEMRQYVDTLIVIPNQRLMQISDKQTLFLDSYREADTVLRKAVQGISEIITIQGLMNVDFADIKAVMANKGTALLGIGAAKGPNRAVEAARNAIHSKLLEVTINGATDAIINICASQSLGINEVSAAVSEIVNNCGKDINIIYGTAINNDLGDELVITVIATGYELKAQDNGYDELAESIYKNMSDENITYDGLDSVYTEEAEDADEDFASNYSQMQSNEKVAQIFGYGDLTKADKKRQKEEEKRRRQEEKRKIKEDKKATSQEPVEETTASALPDWLKKKY